MPDKRIMELIYKCDRCPREHQLDESRVRNKQYHVPPSGCYEGDYYAHHYFWFPCDCGRAIEVKHEQLLKPYSIEKEYTGHYGVCAQK